MKLFLQARIKVDPQTMCWNWQKVCNYWGYGLFRKCGKLLRAHRASYAAYKGPIPPGAFVLHKCDNPRCCNPDHLFLGDAKSNAEDMIAKGRQVRGEKRSQSKLTEAKVREIWLLRDLYTQEEIGQMFGVHRCTINNIFLGKTWMHVD